ncbi:hypothetical protein KW783_02490, partial [Candidatus Parcubacteria bacterium]|nr:hypothetical protein [Candidatus Parcubacteria bacterium]
MGNDDPQKETESANDQLSIIEVVPISRGMQRETLSYFTALSAEIGSVVSVPLRSRAVQAIVVSKGNASDMKSSVKNATFEMRKVSALNAISFFREEFIEAARLTGEYFASSTGAVLDHVIPQKILDSIEELHAHTFPAVVRGNTREKYVIQSDDEERYSNYKSLIREELAKKSSVFFCVPTIEDGRRAHRDLSKGIENFTFVINSEMTKRELAEVWNHIAEEKHPVLLIGTGSFLCLPRLDIGCVILEKEHSRVYKSHARPFSDTRIFAEFFAEKIKAKIVFGDILLRTETIWRQRSLDLIEFAPLKFRSVSTAEQQLIDMRSPRGIGKKEFKIMGDHINSLICETKENNENLFIYGARKGLAPTTVCEDCGQLVLCGNCSAPVILVSSGQENLFICNQCGAKRSAKETCKNCTSWNLKPLGIGVDRIEVEIKNSFPDIDVFKLDRGNVSTHRKAQDIAKKFYATPGSVLIGTDMAFNYLDNKIENTAVVSIDALFSISDFRIHEKIFHTVLALRNLAQKKFVLQTRNPEEKVLHYSLRGNLIDFYKDEIEERKRFGYPPFSVLIKISREGDKQTVIRDMDLIKEVFANFEPFIFPALISTVKGKSIMNALIKIPFFPP